MDDRDEGIYVSEEYYPPPPDVGSTRLIIIEQVAGDGTVGKIMVTEEGALDLLEKVQGKLMRLYKFWRTALFLFLSFSISISDPTVIPAPQP
jgi:hypothetical protein